MVQIQNDGKQGSPGGSAPDPQKEQRKKTFLAVLVMLIPFGICMYLIFGGGSKMQEQDDSRLNYHVPEGRGRKIEASKQKAIDRVASEQKEQQRGVSLDGNSFSLLPNVPAEPEPAKDNSVVGSETANRAAAQVMAGFYSTPRADPQVAELQRQVAELEARLAAQPAAAVDPVEMAEKQYALAAKYLGQPGAGGSAPAAPVSSQPSATEKTPVVAVRGLGDNTVSSLADFEPDSLMADLGRERNLGFNTAVGSSSTGPHNSIRVCVDEDQTLTSGERIRLRLVEPVMAGTLTLPAGELLYGTVSITGQRMQVSVTGIEQGGNILCVALEAYDLDGGKGLFVPNSAERTAVKDAAASIGSGLGSSISFTTNAGQQVAMDLVRGAMTGGTQYIASKLRQVKVSVKAGYQLLLISKD